MPAFLKAPAYKPGGPDGKGWNRLSLCAHVDDPADRCALRPRSYGALWEAYHRPAQWSTEFGRCVGNGACDSCPLWQTRATVRLPSWAGERVLVRLRERDPERVVLAAGLPANATPFFVRDPDRGWDSEMTETSYADLGRLEDGWTIGRSYRDEHSSGFWVVRGPRRANAV